MKGTNKNQTFTFDGETIERLETLSKHFHISKSGLIRLLVWNCPEDYLIKGGIK